MERELGRLRFDYRATSMCQYMKASAYPSLRFGTGKKQNEPVVINNGSVGMKCLGNRFFGLFFRD
jgi:hypothetical protein